MDEGEGGRPSKGDVVSHSLSEDDIVCEVVSIFDCPKLEGGVASFVDFQGIGEGSDFRINDYSGEVAGFIDIACK